jgi:hypothetical protein
MQVPDYGEVCSTYHVAMFGNNDDATRGADWNSDDSDDRMSTVIWGDRVPIFSLRSDIPCLRGGMIRPTISYSGTSTSPFAFDFIIGTTNANRCRKST